MKRTIAVLCALVLGFLAQPASASIFTAGLSYDGIPDLIQDNSVSTLLPGSDTDGVQNAGDVILGVIKWNVNTSTGGDFGNTTMAAFAIQVLTGPDPSGQTVGGKPGLAFSLGPVSIPGFWASFLHDQDAAVGGFSANTIGAVFSSPGGTDLTTVSAGAAFTNAPGMLDDTASWSLDVSFGQVLTTDFFQAIVRDQNNDGKITYATEWVGVSAGSTTGLEAGALSAIINNLGAALLPVTFDDLYGNVVSADIALLPSTILVQADPTQTGHGWAFADQSDVALNPTPEPTSLLIWSLLAAAGWLGMTFWRRRQP